MKSIIGFLPFPIAVSVAGACKGSEQTKSRRDKLFRLEEEESDRPLLGMRLMNAGAHNAHRLGLSGY